jgi:TolB-like protein/Tfp pilus assembly protein PilF
MAQDKPGASRSATLNSENYPLAAPIADVPMPSLNGRKRHSWLVAGVILSLAAVAMLSTSGKWKRLLLHPSAGRNIRSIAVLPLQNLSGDPGQEYFADGMTDALITDLAKLHELRVISRTSVMRYKKSSKSLPEIARELNVDAVMEGSTVRDGNKVRITAQLLQATTDQHLWAENYETDLRNIVNLQGEIASRIADQVEITLSPQEKERFATPRPVDPKAYEAYLKGQSYFEHWTGAGTLEARKYYREAISIDPNYAQAYAALADTYVFGNVTERAEEAYPQGRAAALKALQLDNSLADAHAALAQVKFVTDWDWTGAEVEFKRAIDLNPNGIEARHMYSHFLLAKGLISDSEQQARRMVEIDPLSPVTHEHWAYQLLMSGRYDEAIAEYNKVVEMDPTYADPHLRLGLAYLRKGDSQRSFTEYMKGFEGGGLKSAQLALLQHAYAAHGIRGFWQQLIALETAKTHPDPVSLAAWSANLGRRDDAVHWLQKACEQNSHDLMFAREISDFDVLRADPRLKDMLTTVGFPSN